MTDPRVPRMDSLGRGAWVAIALCALGCEETTEAPAKHPVKARAPFDLHCPERELNFDKLDENTLGVSGCGRHATYVRICRDRIEANPVYIDSEEECRWLMDSAGN